LLEVEAAGRLWGLVAVIQSGGSVVKKQY